ncbi:MAG: hypothetical protein HGB15_08450 [Chlorobaculum sp.]|nr:hypothetical protein [Chlorobaculum sp.]
MGLCGLNGSNPIVVSVMPMLATISIGNHLDQPLKIRDKFVNIKGATLFCKAGKRENR